MDIDDLAKSDVTSGISVKDGLIVQGIRDNILCWVRTVTPDIIPIEAVDCRINEKTVTIQQEKRIRHNGLAYDWISRRLYLSTEELLDSSSETNIYKCDLEGGCVSFNQWPKSAGKISTLLVDATRG